MRISALCIIEIFSNPGQATDFNFSHWWLLLSSADNLCKQFGQNVVPDLVQFV